MYEKEGELQLHIDLIVALNVTFDLAFYVFFLNGISLVELLFTFSYSDQNLCITVFKVEL